MWVEGGDIHDELLDQLGGVLAPPEELALTPSAAELETLAAAVAARWPDGAVVPGDDLTVVSEEAAGPGSPVRPLRSSRPRLRRLGSSAWRAGSVAAGLVVFSASAAAAANGGVPLPRPVRVVAYSVGLPVDSPALDDTHQHIKDLNDAVKANDKPKAEATVRRLLHSDLPKVPSEEKQEAAKKVEAAIVTAQPLIQSPTPTTTTTVPPPSSTTATAGPSSTTATTAEPKETEQPKAPGTTSTTERATTTTTAPEPTTTTTVPETDETPPESTTTTTAPPVEDPSTTTSTTTTTGPPPEETTTTSTSSTTTTTAPPADPGVGVQEQPE